MKVTLTVIFELLIFYLLLACQPAEEEILVTNLEELKKVVEIASPGTDIFLADGVFEGDNLELSAKGTEGKLIRILAKNPGKVTFKSGLKLKSDYFSLEGIQFEGRGSVEIEGEDCRLTQCHFSDSKANKWVRVLPGSKKIEIDHNTFENKTGNTTTKKGCQMVQVIVLNQNEQHHIHHNLFKDIPKGMESNGYETLQLITKGNPFDPPAGDCNSIIEKNLFIRCNGESEIISVKSNGNIIRNNTFRESKGALVLRHGDNNQVTENYFFGEGENGSGGVRFQGSGQVVAHNYFHKLGQFGVSMMDGTPDYLYVRVENGEVSFNTFIDCRKTLTIGLNHSKHPNGTVPKDCFILGNLFYSKQDGEDSPFVKLVQDDEPENFIWSNNLVFGKPQPLAKGFFEADPVLEFQNNHIGLPTQKTPSFQLEIPEKEFYTIDLLGQQRGMNKTVGAIQFPVDSLGFKPVSEKETGTAY
ncbi:polysaccharide lyase 6 family protein [Flexithrix dorotheae]|uniref:polysaccharide lyase 6 family protein n=1 Tax=Flexithrix dorotheae TaxID=70993 RepID=UPI0003762B0F|nr:polysaccharide lyase 6 family protein [Flexithrix dorotheae]